MFMGKITDSLEKMVYAGVGLTSTTIEKAGELIHEMAEKGEASIGRSKATNKELKHDIKQTTSKDEDTHKKDDVVSEDRLNKLTDDELSHLKEQIESIQKNRQS